MSLRNQNKIDDPLPEVIKQKIYFDKNELAALKIIKVWESLVNDSFPQTPLNWKKFHLFLKLMKFRGLIGKFLRSLQFGKSGNFKINHKFPKLNKMTFKKDLITY